MISAGMSFLHQNNFLSQGLFFGEGLFSETILPLEEIYFMTEDCKFRSGFTRFYIKTCEKRELNP